MHLDKFVHSPTGKILMSVILGFGLATLFRAVCKGNRCRIVSAPPLEELDDQIYKFDDSCYQMTRNAVTCDAKKQTIHI
jgi:hypothetical protein